jgi:D-alanyl-D-alanine carboxypeptidase/D-alanyl-D-alanine-endopeptidase (penicillin-binding protein 4)
MVDVLKHVFHDDSKRDLFITSLARPGSDGTLRRRMKDLPGRVWAKTGYLTGVRTLSGYIQSADEQWFAFSILFNNIPGGTAPYNKIHDTICRTLASPE